MLPPLGYLESHGVVGDEPLPRVRTANPGHAGGYPGGTECTRARSASSTSIALPNPTSAPLGWIVLGRAFDKLLFLEQGWLAGQNAGDPIDDWSRGQ